MSIDEMIKFFEKNRTPASTLGGGEYNPKALAYAALAQKSFDSQDFVTSINLYSEALKFQPSNWYFLAQRATSYRMLNEYDKALVDAFKSKAIDDNFENNQTIALCYLFKEEYLKATEFFDSAITHLDNNQQNDINNLAGADYGATKSRALNNQAVCYYHLRLTDKAIASTSRGIIENPTYPNNYFVRAMTYVLLGDKARATIDLQKAAYLGDNRANGMLAKL